MVALPQMFDATQVEPSTGTATIHPAGWYGVVITASELKPTKDNSGKFIQFDRKIIQAENSAAIGGTITERLNVVNASQQAVEIANKQLSAICHVTGVFKLSDTAQLHNIPHRVRIDIAHNAEGKPIGNNVMEYQDQHGNPPHRAGAGAPMVSPQGTHSAVAAPQAPPAAAGWGPPAGQAPQQPQQAAAWGAPPAGPAAPPGNTWGQPPGQAPQAPPAAWGAPPQR